ncbi:MAG: PaaI family thioesterase, partial [Candidatus Aramenus sp.]|nr:PaaI family thioesterase [Candidatus Aramenus sp.]
MDVHKILQHEEPFFKFLGLKLLEVREGFAKLELEYKEELTRRGKVLHGGVIMSSIDYAGGIATMTVNDGVDQVTQELKVNFLEPMYKGPFTVEANVVRRGRTA